MANRFLNNIRINDAYTFPASDGNDGQVITTDGAGNLGFENISPDAASVIYRDNFTGDGSTVAFDLQNSITDEDQTQIYIDGVYQEKSTYSISGTTITFTTAPILGHSVEVISISSINTGPTVLYQDNFTGNGSDTAFTLGQAIDNEIKTFIFLNGVYQFKNTYTVDGTTLTFDAAPANGVAIEIVSIASAVQSDSLEAGAVIIPVKNTHTASIAKGTPVYISGNVGASERLQIAPADASNSAKMPSAGLLLTTLAVNAEGYAITGGYLRNITTDTIDGTSTASNDTVYVKAGGGLTMTKPTGTNLIQNIAKVARSASGSSGSLLVSSILRTNDIPNIANDHFWLGNSSSVATATSFPTEVGNYLTTNSYATQSYVGTQISNLVDSSPATLNTLNELAAALGDDPNFATTTANSIGLKAPLASPSFTGTPVLSNRMKTQDGSAQMNIGQWDGVNHRIEADANRPLKIYSYNTSSGIAFGISGSDKLTINGNGSGITVAGAGNFTGNISGVRGFFNSGATNVVATFTSTDGTATLQCADPTGNVEFGASGNNFVVQPAGGAAQLTVGSSSSTFAGNVGIGVTPSQKLEVNGAAKWFGATSTDFAQTGGQIDYYDTFRQFRFNAYKADSTGAEIVFNTGGTTSFNQRMVIDSLGNVGIGIGSPSTLLHLLGADATVQIQGSGTSSNAGVNFFPRDASNVAHLQSIKGVDSSLTFLTGGNSGNSYVPTERIRIDSSGRTSIIGVFESSASQGILNLKQSSGVGSLGMGFHDTGSNPHFWLQSRSNSNYATTYNLALQPNGGNVGIGSDNPQSKLQVTTTGYDTGTTGFRLTHAEETNYVGYARLQTPSGDPIFSLGTIDGATTYETLSMKNSNVGIGVTSPTQKLDVAGIVKHQGLDMTAGIQVDQTTSISSSLSGAAGSWHETGIDGTDIGNNGSYMVQVYSNTQGAGASNYSMYWTGTMSWYALGTNSGNTSEIYLNSAGHYRGMDLELRTISSANSATPPSMRIQFKSNQTLTGHAVVFKFRRLM
jgi:hypothetical protein